MIDRKNDPEISSPRGAKSPSETSLPLGRTQAVIGASVIDVFCGVGGLAHGFRLEGFPLACGIDLDEGCRYAFEANNEAPFIRRDVSDVSGDELNGIFHAGTTRVLIGCAPCQPFSLYNQKNDDPRWTLLGEFARLITETRPEVVSMENVPRLVTFQRGSIFTDFVSKLENAGYSVWFKSVFCPEYGVPQSRTRLVLLASRLGPIRLEPPTHAPEEFRTVADAIGHHPAIEAGEIDRIDPLHRSSGLSAKNLARMKAARPGGTWRDWNPELVTECHRRDSGRTFPSVYGRMRWNDLSPTITTQFHGFGNGRFGHPEQDRAISLREGAVLQSFPKGYEFVAPGENIHFSRLGRMIGNAVPVLLARAIARTIRSHIQEQVGNG